MIGRNLRASPRTSLRRLFASVRARSTAGVVIVVAVGGIAGSLLVVFLLQRALIDTVQINAATRAADVANLMSTSTTGAVRRDLEQNTPEPQLVQIVDAAGRVVASSSTRAGERELSSLRPAPGVVQREQRNTLDFLRTKDPYLITARGVRQGGETLTVIVAASIGPQSESVEQLITYLVVFVPIAILLVGVGTWLLVGRALRPVESIRARVAHIQADWLTERVPVPPSHDEVARLASTMNEMLDRLEIGQQLQRSFVSDASHELRSPLATLGVSLDVVGDDPSSARWHETREVMRAEVRRMSRLVDDLLLLAKLDDGGARLATEEVDLDDLVGEEVRRLRSGGRIDVDVSIVPIRVRGDRAKLAQVVRNVVENAANAAHGRIRLSVSGSETDAVLAVEDDGSGIPVADRGRVFDRFVRLDASRSRDSGGSGLGLAIVDEIVKAHGGAVSVEDSMLGGARIVVRLPVSA